ncbi:MAG: proprotein convertase P-domain-containing protein [Myxococcota bacterium]|nr:proprotein convertase P-domain-containing protein [Myxococcota bacterium]
MRTSRLLTTLAFGLALSACAEDGKDGTNGTNGADGTNGEDGVDGVDGETGADGADGLCADATPIEITGIAGMTGETEYIGFESGTMTVESNADAGTLSYTVAGYGFDYAWTGDDFTVTPTTEAPSSQVIIATDGCTTATYEFDIDAEYGLSLVNIVHVFEGAPSVDVAVAGGTADDAFITGFEFGSDTGYLTAYSTPALALDLFVDGALASTTPDLALLPGAAYTVVVYPDAGAVAYAVLEDDLSETSAADQVRVTALHGADGVGQVDVWELLSGTALVSDLDFGASGTLEATAAPVELGLDVDDDGTADFQYSADLTLFAGSSLNAIAYMDQGAPKIFVAAPSVGFSGILSFCDATTGVECVSEPGGTITYGVTLTDSISVAGACTVDNVIVSVDISHSYVGDITGTLSAPDGTSVEILTNRGYSADDIVGTFAADGSGFAQYIYTSTSGNAYTYAQPDMSDFIGVDAAGDWTFTIDDTYSGDDGTLNSWGLTFTCQ